MASSRALDPGQGFARKARYSAGMRALRGHRRWLSGWLVALLLLVQWATAAYACPQLAGDATQGPPAMMDMASMPDCNADMAAMDPLQPQLCKAHCEAGQQSVNSGAAAPDAPAVVAVSGRWAGVLDPARAVAIAEAVPPLATAPPRSGAPPIYLSLHVLRN